MLKINQKTYVFSSIPLSIRILLQVATSASGIIG